MEDRAKKLLEIADLQKRLAEISLEMSLDNSSPFLGVDTSAHILALELATDMTVIMNMDRSITFVSPNCKFFCGWSSNDLLGKVISEFMHSDDIDRVDDFSKGRGHILKHRLLTPSKNWMWVESRTKKVGTTIICNVRDITEQEIQRKKAKQAEQALQTHLQELAFFDALTGLHNRRAGVQAAKREVKWSQREKIPLSIVLMDIDLFKRINDTYGHNTGDSALKMVAKKIESNLRETDIAIRWGGEEFLMLLPNTNSEGATLVAERIREKLSEDKELGFQITASLGITTKNFGDDDQRTLSHELLIREADLALYHAKDQGRNQVQAYSEKLDKLSPPAI